MTAQELVEFRSQIDILDREIIALLEKRHSLVEALQPFKTTPTDMAREQAILNRIDSPYVRHIYLAIFEASKSPSCI